MGFMDVLKKIGKIGATAAPYIAAPFTGGASLAFAPIANQGVGAWNAKDARSAAAKGIAPSKFDQYLGLAGNVAGMAGGAGAFGKGNFGASKFAGGSSFGGDDSDSRGMGGGNIMEILGGLGKNKVVGNDLPSQGGITGTMGKTGKTDGGGGWLSTLGKIAGIAGPAIGGLIAGKSIFGGDKKEDPSTDNTGSNQSSRPPIGPSEGVMPRGGFSYRNQPLNQYNQNEPNLALALHQGRQEAIAGQPWRSGYDTRWISKNTEGEPVENFASMPAIYPNVQSQRRSERRDDRQANRPAPEEQAAEPKVRSRAGRREPAPSVY